MILRQTVANHIRVLPTTLITTALYLGILWYHDFKSDLVLIFAIGYILTVVPSFYLHLNYYLKNKGFICQILPDKVIIIKKGVETIIEAISIKDVVVYKSASIEPGGIPITPMESYFFVRIFDHSDKEYNLSCLLDPKIDKSIKTMRGIKVWTERGVFNNIS